MHPLEPFKYCPRCGAEGFAIDSERGKRCSRCGFVFYANAAAAVAAVITNSTGEVLLTTRAFEPAKGMLDLPGGFVDHGETAEQALRREVREELGVEITDIHYIMSKDNIYPFGGIEVHTLDMIFTARIADDARLCPADDVSNAQFYHVTDVIINKIGLDSIRRTIALLHKENKL